MSKKDFKIIYEGDPAQGWMHSGIAILSDGRLVFEATGGHGLIFLHLETGAAEKVPVDIAVAHGIAVTRDADGDRIWICDPGESNPGKVVAINLRGEIVKELTPPETSPSSKEMWRPTSIAITDDGAIWVADGYGLSLVHRYSPAGDVMTIDGRESGLNFKCPHGVAVDNRESEIKIVVADRGNKRLVFFDTDGRFNRSVAAEVMTSPSSIAISGANLAVTDLRGAILAVSKDDQVSAVIPSTQSDGRPHWPNALVDGEVAPPAIEEGEINSPHGIVASDSGRIFATEWYFGGRVISLANLSK
jgi:hypothetical protein